MIHPHVARHLILLSSTLVALILFVACGDDDTTPVASILATANASCSRVGTTGDLAQCETGVREAQGQCLTLSAIDRPRCEATLDELLRAEQEAAHLVRGECDQMTSDAARSACHLASLASPTPTNTVQGAAPSAGAVIANTLAACSADDADVACKRSMQDAQAICDQLTTQSERDACKHTLDGLRKSNSGGAPGRGKGKGD